MIIDETAPIAAKSTQTSAPRIRTTSHKLVPHEYKQLHTN